MSKKMLSLRAAACDLNGQMSGKRLPLSDLDKLKAVTGREVLTINEIDNYDHLDDFCALIKACDLVISIDNSTVHFTGALGQKCHVLLPFSHQSDWRWGLNGASESYQYDNMFLHWQRKPGDWQSCLEDLRKKLRSIYEWHKVCRTKVETN